MLFVSSYYDIKKREIHDLVWLVSGTVGVIVTILSVYGNPDVLSMIYVGMASGIVSLIMFLLKKGGTADIFALLTMSAIYPHWVSFGNFSFPFPLVAYAAGSLMSFLFNICWNAYWNSQELFKSKKIFPDVSEYLNKKIIAFFLIHKNRGEQFTFPGTISGQEKLKFKFSANANTQEFAKEFDKYVQLALPLLPFILASSILILLVQKI